MKQNIAVTEAEHKSRVETHKKHPIARPHGRAMGCLLWGFGRKLDQHSTQMAIDTLHSHTNLTHWGLVSHGRIVLWLPQGIQPVIVGHTSYCMLIYGRIMHLANRWKRCYYMVQWNRKKHKSLQWLKQNIIQRLYSLKTSSQISPLWSSYGVSNLNICGKLTAAPNCIIYFLRWPLIANLQWLG